MNDEQFKEFMTQFEYQMFLIRQDIKMTIELTSKDSKAKAEK